MFEFYKPMLLVFLFLMMSLFSSCTHDMSAYPYNQPVKNITGLKIPVGYKPSQSALKFLKGVGLPETFDWRDKGISAVENQGSCGSCWAFATASVFEDNVKLATGIEKDFSEQYLVDCVKESSGCDGGWSAHEYHYSKGFKGGIEESDYRYTGKDGKCKSGLKASDSIIGWREVANTTDDIKAAIYNYGPVWTSVYVDGNFQKYTDGVFRSCGKGQNNHAVTLVGWGKDHWILKNSWGKGWGDDGYMKIAFGCSGVGYASNFIYYKKKVDPEPSPDPKPEPKPEPKPDPDNAKCKGEDSSASMRSGTYIYPQFVNRHGHSVKIYWLDKNAKRVPVFNLKAGRARTIRTFLRHGWVAVDGSGKCVSLYYPKSKSHRTWVIK